MSPNKRYQTISEYYLKKYNHKVAKIALNAPFSCPNRDGKKGYGGCTYCSKMGSGDTGGDAHLSIKEQFLQIKEKIDLKWKDCYYIPYLQSYSNTYATLNYLKQLYEEVLSLSDRIVEFAIATRADCLSMEVLDYLEELNKKIHLTIELGLQTANEETGIKINRCLTNDEVITAVNNLKKRQIKVVIHIINGLPDETEKDMLKTIEFVNKLEVDGIKFHCLLLLKDTKLANAYLANPFPILSLQDYVKIVVKQIKHLNPNIYIHRLAADAKRKDLIAPLWANQKLVIMNEIDKLLKLSNSYQGDEFK